MEELPTSINLKNVYKYDVHETCLPSEALKASSIQLQSQGEKWSLSEHEVEDGTFR